MANKYLLWLVYSSFFEMTLHEYLIENGLRLEKKMEVRLGELVSDEYRNRYTKSAPKVFSQEFDALLNDYTHDFLTSCSLLIIKFINPQHEPQNG